MHTYARGRHSRAGEIGLVLLHPGAGEERGVVRIAQRILRDERSAGYMQMAPLFEEIDIRLSEFACQHV